MSVREADVVVIGGGLCGLTVAAQLGDRAVVVEREARPGGLVRTDCRAGWWFDHVLHLLHVPDAATERLVRGLLGEDLAPCPPRAWVECASGTVAYPFQLHLSGLDPEARDRCVADFASATHAAPAVPPRNYEELLLATFGEAMCEQFYFPYNRKLWRRPLSELAAKGFQWNLTRPSVEEVLRGASGADGRAQAYNSNGWYPRPSASASVRGMEVLSRALADRVADLRLGHRVVRIDPDRRVVTCEHDGRIVELRYRAACVSTIPLPAAVEACRSAPTDLRTDCRRLPSNRVRTVAFSVVGPRPTHLGHWRYYADERLRFSRLVFLTNFDPLLAPPEGWGLLAEVIERGDDPPAPASALMARVRADVATVGAVAPGATIVDAHVIDADPAYVVFTPHSISVSERARAFLSANGIVALGRYGNWEYSSMAQVMTDAIRWAAGWRETG